MWIDTKSCESGLPAKGNDIPPAPAAGPQRVLLIAMPGVPSEMYLMFGEQIRDRLIRTFALQRIIAHRKINAFGAGESDVESKLLDITHRGREPEVGITVHDATISLRIAAAAETEEEAIALTGPTAEIIYERLGSLVFSEGDEELQHVVARLLRSGGLTVATAEGCTGGIVAARLVSVPGASQWYCGGVVAYTNQAKRDWLAVPSELIEQHGAASRETAEAMAISCSQRFGSDVAVATVGIAGPGGATADKPVGTLCVAVTGPFGTTSHRFTVWGDRVAAQSRGAKHALNQLRLALQTTTQPTAPPR
jgi:nicotinamide-nucleotide amidase